LRANVESLAKLVDHATSRLLDDHSHTDSPLRADARDMDASYHALISTAQPLRRSFFGPIDEEVGASVRLAAASRHYGRNLVADVEITADIDCDTRNDIERGSETLRRSLNLVASALNGPRDGTYIRSSSLFDQAEQRLESTQAVARNPQLAIRDLKAIDQAMAAMAQVMNLNVTDYDTARFDPASAVSAQPV
jgi:hypothetical protein